MNRPETSHGRMVTWDCMMCMFHTWGGTMGEVYALVESNNGTIHRAKPEDLKFDDEMASYE